VQPDNLLEGSDGFEISLPGLLQGQFRSPDYLAPVSFEQSEDYKILFPHEYLITFFL
jgi:hypothetical protein